MNHTSVIRAKEQVGTRKIYTVGTESYYKDYLVT